MLTAAYVDTAHQDRGFEAGADAYMAKPFLRRALLAQVRAVLGDPLPSVPGSSPSSPCSSRVVWPGCRARPGPRPAGGAVSLGGATRPRPPIPAACSSRPWPPRRPGPSPS
jgi:hypothetical protein